MMLGKSVGSLRWGLLLVTLVACAHNVAQDAATSADGKIKGAKQMTMDNGEAKASGIVTYPGGDRVDWKFVELPEKKRGTAEIKLTWNPPRPGLQLAFDVFDDFNSQIAGSKKLSKKRAKSSGRTRSATVDNVTGKLFIRIYAVGRGDAGKYRLTVNFTEKAAGLKFDPLKLDINDPPKLAAVPDVEVGCDEFNFDTKIPACKLVCPAAGAPPGWPGCKGKCPNPPTVDEPSCWATMPCPKGQPDERIKACKPKDWPPCPNKDQPDDSNPNCRVKAAPVVGRIIGKKVEGTDLVLTVAIGTANGVKKGWTAMVVRSNEVTSPAVPGGNATVDSIDANVTRVRVKGLTADQVSSTPWVRLQPQ